MACTSHAARKSDEFSLHNHLKMRWCLQLTFKYLVEPRFVGDHLIFHVNSHKWWFTWSSFPHLLACGGIWNSITAYRYNVKGNCMEGWGRCINCIQCRSAISYLTSVFELQFFSLLLLSSPISCLVPSCRTTDTLEKSARSLANIGRKKVSSLLLSLVSKSSQISSSLPLKRNIPTYLYWRLSIMIEEFFQHLSVRTIGTLAVTLLAIRFITGWMRKEQKIKALGGHSPQVKYYIPFGKWPNLLP